MNLRGLSNLFSSLNSDLPFVLFKIEEKKIIKFVNM